MVKGEGKGSWESVCFDSEANLLYSKLARVSPGTLNQCLIKWNFFYREIYSELKEGKKKKEALVKNGMKGKFPKTVKYCFKLNS